MTLATQIDKPTCNVFRRAYIKRRDATTGRFETSWQNITEFVKSFGNSKIAIDDIRLNRITLSGVDLIVRNDTGKFSAESKSTSIFSGYLTRYRTLVKLEAGYYDTNGTSELPTDSAQGVFIMDQPVPIDGSTNEVTIKCGSLNAIFDEVYADEIPGMATTQTASQIFARIRDHTDGSGDFIFREFITSTAWTIQTTTTQYGLSTDTSLLNLSVWDLMLQLAEVENHVVLINRTGGVEFRNRQARDSTPSVRLRGLGFAKMNVIEVSDYSEALDKYINFVRLKFRPENTTTSYVEAGTITSVDPTNLPWKYGIRTYEFENRLFNTSTAAQSAVTSLYNEFSTPKEELTVLAKFLPHVEVNDLVSISYQGNQLAGDLWDVALFDDIAVWSGDESIDFNAEQFIIVSRETDLDDFTTKLRLREV